MSTGEFMQYTDEPELTDDQQDVLSSYGQFYSCTADFEFLARLRSGKAKRKERDKWFNANFNRQVWFLAQGILASVYGEDPP